WEKVPALVAVVRASDLTYEFANEAFCKATLFDEPPIGRPFGEDQAARSDFDFRALLRRIAETGEPFERSDVFVSLGARDEAWFDLSYQPMRDEHGAVTSILLFAIDVPSTHVARRDLEAHAE